MFAVVGLGNPGSRYAFTRHNLGFWVVEALAPEHSSAYGGQDWSKKFGCSYMKVRFSGSDALLVLPQKFMNLSGEAALPLLRYFRIGSEQSGRVSDRLIVIHDDLDLDPGTIRIRRGGSAAGHRGVGNVASALGRNDFYRVRVGIGHPRRRSQGNTEEISLTENTEQIQADTGCEEGDVTDWVLGSPGPKEKELLEKAVPVAASAVVVLVKEGLEAAQRKYHQRQRKKPGIKEAVEVE